MIFIANALTMSLQMLNLGFNEQASILSHSEYGIGPYWQVAASIPKLIYETFVGSYFSQNALQLYVSPLWTMRIEMIGSMIVVFWLLIRNSIRKNEVLTSIVILVTVLIDIRLICFF